MRIDPKHTLLNQPILKIRDIVRYIAWKPNTGFQMQDLVDYVCTILNQPEPVAKQILKMLVRDRYFRRSRNKIGTRYFYCFESTKKGRVLAMSKGNPAISKAKAQLLLEELRQRIKEVNQNNDFAYTVDNIKVSEINSFSDDILEAVDVIISLAPRKIGDSFRKQRDERIDLAIESGRHFPNIADMYYWPCREVIMSLSTRKKGINLYFQNISKKKSKADDVL